MSTKLDILTAGYARPVVGTDSLSEATYGGGGGGGTKFMRATGSSCLVRSAGQCKVLFDTMGPWEKDLLVDRLAKLKVHPDDVDYLVCSHSHPDHIGNLNLFTRAKKHFVGTSVYTQDLYDLNCFEPSGSYTYMSPKFPNAPMEVIKYQTFELAPNLHIEPTPGHTMECISMIVDNCERLGTVALAGDLFEEENDVQDERIWLGAGSQNADLQRASRSRIYNKVDYILPGHGDLFKTNGQKEF